MGKNPISQSPPALSAPEPYKKEKRGVQKERAVGTLGNDIMGVCLAHNCRCFNAKPTKGSFLPYRLKYRRLGLIRRFWRRFLHITPTSLAGDSRSTRRTISLGI